MKKPPAPYFSLQAFGLIAVPVSAFLCWKWGIPSLVAWLLAANAAAYVLWAIDKRQARRNGWRVPEMTLHAMAILGASPASIFAMQQLRHKTRKFIFRPLYIFFLAVQLSLLFLWCSR